ncbi:hypothetical protein KEM48_000814 [Puccinia striiformis f. sp. tritici PST-130]|nr:hypothetical protein KEM48_000814 [Puccinia striiformis f. sp. tritici PST-130]
MDTQLFNRANLAADIAKLHIALPTDEEVEQLFIETAQVPATNVADESVGHTSQLYFPPPSHLISCDPPVAFILLSQPTFMV